MVQYDKNHSGALEFEELRSVLADLGLLVGPHYHPYILVYCTYLQLKLQCC
jgi:hypothetical protein